MTIRAKRQSPSLEWSEAKSRAWLRDYVVEYAPDLAQLVHPELCEVIDASIERAEKQLLSLLLTAMISGYLSAADMPQETDKERAVKARRRRTRAAITKRRPT